MDQNGRIQSLQEKTGYVFRDPDLLARALRHSSFLNEHGMAYTDCNERLEYLGDAVLELVSSRFLFDAFPDRPEGELTRMRATLVCENALAAVARELELGDCLEMGRGEEKTGGRTKASVLSDAVEALIGAIYLDGGPESARAFIERFVLNDLEKKLRPSDHKTLLQELLQKKGPVKIEYATEEQSGPRGVRFVSEVSLDGVVLGRGAGHSKKEAEQDAAGQALLKQI